MEPPKMHHTASPDEPYPSAAALASATTSRTQRNFTVRSRKLPISKSAAIDAMSAALTIPVPEMIFGDNVVSVTHNPSGWQIAFSAYDGLDQVDKTDKNMLQVAYAGAWSESRERTSAGIKEVVRPFDWSYSTTYRGSVSSSSSSPPPNEAGSASATARELQPSSKPIPLELLKRRDPILFNDEVILYESELDDNGISMLSVKFRVMGERMLLLCRLYMRLDNVVVRVRDTRVYVDFLTDEVIREYTAREDKFDNVKRNLMMTGLLPDAVIIAMRDANQVANLLPIVEQQLESVSLSL